MSHFSISTTQLITIRTTFRTTKHPLDKPTHHLINRSFLRVKSRLHLHQTKQIIN